MSEEKNSEIVESHVISNKKSRDHVIGKINTNEPDTNKSKKPKTTHLEEEKIDDKNDEYNLNPKDYAVWMPPEGNLFV